MSKTIARDLLRVIAFIPYATHNIEACVERAWWWADDVFVASDSESDQKLDAEVFNPPMAGRPNPFDVAYLQSVWSEMEERLDPQEGDYIVYLRPDEFLVNGSTMRSAIRSVPDSKITAMSYYMVDPDHYSEVLKPHMITIAGPYKPDGRNIQMSAARGPHYMFPLPALSRPATEVLDYALADDVNRFRYRHWWDDTALINVWERDKTPWHGPGKRKELLESAK